MEKNETEFTYLSKNNYENSMNLQNLNEEYFYMMENIDDLISVYNENFDLEYFNEKTHLRILKYDIDKLKDPSFMLSIMHDDDRKKTINIIQEGFKRGFFTFQIRLKPKIGNYLWFENKARVFINNRGMKKVFNVCRDITKQKEMEHELEESKELFRTIAEKSFVGIGIIQDNQIKYVNDITSKILEYSTIEMLKWSTHDLVKKCILSEDITSFLKQRKAIKTGNYYELPYISFRIISKSGKIKWIDQFSNTIRYKEKEAELVVIIDNSTKIKAERIIDEENKKLMDIGRIKSELVSRASHELKTPLVSVYGATQLLLENYEDQISEDAFRLIKIIHRGGKRLKDLVENLLDVSRIESDKLKLSLNEENLGKIILECCENMDYLIENREISLFIDVADDIYLKVDKLRIEQIITNLLSNSIKNSVLGGKVYLSLKNFKDHVDISVRDAGVGITLNEKERLFEKFGKIERYGKGMGVDIEGSGLGLYICKQMVELHKGKIWMESKGRNKGAIFIVRLFKNLEA